MYKKIFSLLLILFEINFSSAYCQRLWGMTANGGTNNGGTIFEYNVATSTYTKKFDFDVPGSSNQNGSLPYGSLLQACNGKLYGMTSKGGSYDKGVLFEFDPATNNYTKKLDFDGFNGAYPQGSLIQSSNGKIYGITDGGNTTIGTGSGSEAGGGILFEYDPNNDDYNVKFDFDIIYTSPGSKTYSGTNGASPRDALVEIDNKLFGVTSEGGKNGGGVIFQYDLSSNSFMKKVDFDSIGHSEGSIPNGPLLRSSSGKLFGTLENNGNNCGECSGAIFQYDLVTNVYEKIFNFTDYHLNGSDIYGAVKQAANGKLYGATFSGGTNVGGVLYEYDPINSQFTAAINLIYQSATGYAPNGQLLQASNEKLYGTTQGGGSNSLGVIYEYDPGNSYTKLYDFDGLNGANPSQYSSLIEVTGAYSCSSPLQTTICSNADIDLTSTLSASNYQWQINTGSGFVNINDNSNYSGTSSNSLHISNIPLSWYGYQYRCLADGINDKVFILQFNNTWVGSFSTSWDNSANWECGSVPTDSTDVLIPAGTANAPTITSTVQSRNLTINSGASLTINSNGILQLHGDFVNNGSFMDNGTLDVAGKNNLTIPGGTYTNIKISGGNIINIDAPVTVTGNLDLSNGKILLGDIDFTVGDAATITNEGSSSYFVITGSGKLIQNNIGSGGKQGNIIFPVGTSSSSYTPLTLNNELGIADNFGISMSDGVYSNYSGFNPVGSPLSSSAVKKTWYISEDIPGGSNASLTLQWNQEDELPGFNRGAMFMSRFNGTNWEPGSIGSASGNNPYTFSRNNISNFSPWAVASQGSVLPLNLLEFNGSIINNTAILNWKTSNEINTQEFIIERSIDGMNYSSIGTEISFNTPGVHFYNFTDTSIGAVGTGVVFYRLNQKDIDGRSSYSKIVVLQLKNNKSLVILYPNPSQSQINILLHLSRADKIKWQITDMSGRTIKQDEKQLFDESNNFSINISNLAPGIYHFSVRGNTLNSHLQFVKQ